jgi:hypothetical protein
VEPVVGLTAQDKAWEVGLGMYHSPASAKLQQLTAAGLTWCSVVTAAAAVVPCRGG